LVVGLSAQREASLVGLAIVAEYAWDSRKFDAPRAINLTLKMLFDERSRAGLRDLMATLGDCRGGKNVSAEADAGAPKQKSNDLRATLESITGTRERGLLRGELAKLINQNHQ
jgi:hypothetical protein